MVDIKGALTKKIGPFPGFVWVGLAVGGLLVYRHLHPSTSSSTPTTATATDPTAGLDTSGGGIGGIGGGGPTTPDTTTPTSSDSGSSQFTTDPSQALQGLADEIAGLFGSQSQQPITVQLVTSPPQSPQAPSKQPVSPSAGGAGSSSGYSAADVAKALGTHVGAPEILPYTVTSPSGKKTTAVIDLADIPASLANEPIVPIPEARAPAVATTSPASHYVIEAADIPSGAAAVKSGTEKVNYQAKAKAI